MSKTDSFPKMYMIIVGLMIASASFLNAQTKKEVQFSLDTLAKSHQNLQQDLTSMKADWKKQNIFFEHVKSSFFDPTDINTSIDDGVSKFDEIHKINLTEFEDLTKANKALSDSFALYKKRSEKLISQNNAFNEILLSSLSRASFPQSVSEFIGTWDLFLNPVQLSGEPFEAGIIAHNPFTPKDSVLTNSLYKIEFAEDEIATLYFKGGKSHKSFYSIKDFSINSPYTIKFSKNEDFKLTMLISPIPSGLMVSYELPHKAESVYYFYGLMKK